MPSTPRFSSANQTNDRRDSTISNSSTATVWRVVLLLILGGSAFFATFSATKRFVRRSITVSDQPLQTPTVNAVVTSDFSDAARAASVKSVTNAPGPTPTGMVWIPGGDFTMGSDSELAWPEESPAHRVRVDGFWMDMTDVTNADFAKFVAATGYVTTAEKPPELDEIMKQMPAGTPAPAAKDLVAGSLVFQPTSGEVPLDQGAGAAVVALDAECRLAPSRGPQQQHPGTRRSPSRPGLLG